MKPLRWITDRNSNQEMMFRQEQNRKRYVSAEAWMSQYLEKTGIKWTRQAVWGRRIFDFWSHQLGVAVEVDGAGHKKKIDEYRDTYNFHRSGIIVIRVRNFNEDDAEEALRKIAACTDWMTRREKLGLHTAEGKIAFRKRWKEAGCLEDFHASLFDGLP